MAFDLFNWLANQGVGAAGGPDKVFGTKPQVAPFEPLSLNQAQAQAVSTNLGNSQSIMAMLDRFVPGFTDMIRQGTSNSLSLEHGIIPADVQAQVQRSDAYQALMGGFSGTDMSKALSARDFGLTSLNLQQMGANSAQQWAKLAESSYSPFMITTGQQAAATAANNAGQQATQQYQYNVNAAPDPGAAGIFNLQAALGSQALSIGTGFLGGAIGGRGASLGSRGSSALSGGSTGGSWYGNASGTPSYQYNPSTFAYQLMPQQTWGT